MKYSELVEKLNEQYKTTIFCSKYYGDIDIDDQHEVSIEVDIIGLDARCTVNKDSLQVKDFFCFGPIDVNSLKKLQEAKVIDEVKKLNKKLEEEIERLRTQLSDLNSLKAVIGFSQDTILKAIKGDNMGCDRRGVEILDSQTERDTTCATQDTPPLGEKL